MTKNELITAVAKKTDLPIEDCGAVLDAFTEEITNLLVRGDKLLLANFMSFETAVRPEHEGMNFVTGKKEMIPESRSVKVKASKKLKSLVNGK